MCKMEIAVVTGNQVTSYRRTKLFTTKSINSSPKVEDNVRGNVNVNLKL
jgi:hypothetical protein